MNFNNPNNGNAGYSSEPERNLYRKFLPRDYQPNIVSFQRDKNWRKRLFTHGLYKSAPMQEGEGRPGENHIKYNT